MGHYLTFQLWVICRFGSQLNDQFSRDSERKALFCNFGKLYPEGIEAFSKVGDLNTLTDVLSKYDTFHRLWTKAQSEGKTLQDALNAYEVHINRLAFESQSHFACFYAYIKLKMQERRNMYWIASCIYEGRDQKDFSRYAVAFLRFRWSFLYRSRIWFVCADGSRSSERP